MEILADSRPQKNQDLEGCIFNVSIRISGGRSVCVGLRYIGGGPDNTRNYRLDHVNLWKEDVEEPQIISRQETQKLLRSHGILLRDVPAYLE